jgi:hypothetical protein
MFALILLAQAPVQILGPGCETVGTEVMCPPADVNDPHFGAVARSQFSTRVRRAREALEENENMSRDLRKRVGKLISERDCAGAYKLALEEGDLDLAAKSQMLCPRVQTHKVDSQIAGHVIQAL